MEPEYVVIGQVEVEGMKFELVVFRDEAETVRLGLSDVFWAQPRVRISRLTAAAEAYTPGMTSEAIEPR